VRFLSKYFLKKDEIDHFEMVQFIKSTETRINIKNIQDFYDKDKLDAALNMLEDNFEEVLWPFFASRIPSINQPMVIEAISKNLIESFDEVTMLEKFGKKTIANPFVLEYSGN
jgi:hypothetical protein